MNENYKEAPVTTDGGFGDIQADLNNNFGYIKDAFNNIDSAISGAVIFGEYTGDGQWSQSINIGKRPKAVEVYRSDGIQYDGGDYYGGLAIDGKPCVYSLNKIIEITETGFNVHYVTLSGSHDVRANEINIRYYYKAYINGTVTGGE